MCIDMLDVIVLVHVSDWFVVYLGGRRISRDSLHQVFWVTLVHDDCTRALHVKTSSL